MDLWIRGWIKNSPLLIRVLVRTWSMTGTVAILRIALSRPMSALPLSMPVEQIPIEWGVGGDALLPSSTLWVAIAAPSNETWVSRYGKHQPSNY
jgi:hypothetical protein